MKDDLVLPEGRYYTAMTFGAEVIEPCADKSRGFQWPVFIGGAPSITHATVIRVDADAAALKITRLATDGTVGAERSWRNSPRGFSGIENRRSDPDTRSRYAGERDISRVGRVEGNGVAEPLGGVKTMPVDR